MTITIIDVYAQLKQTVSADPRRIDRRPSADLPPRYLDQGQPACLVAVVLAELGVSTGVLRALDREPGSRGAGIRLWGSFHPVQKRFTRDAWALLALVQAGNDRGYSWQWVIDVITAVNDTDRNWLWRIAQISIDKPASFEVWLTEG